MANMYIRWPSTYVSGTITPVQPNPALLNATVTQGPAAALSGAWPIKVSDGINYAAIKAASTAPVATDPALVVALSPNSPISISIPSDGLTGAAVPASASYIGGNKAGILTGFVLDGSSNLLVSLATALPAGTNTIGSINNISGTISLPTGAATSAKQDSEIALLTTIDADTATLAAGVVSNRYQTQIKGIDGTIDATNSTTVALAGGANFTGSWVQITDFASIQVGIYADQNSAVNGFKLEFSENGSTVSHTHTYNYEVSSNGSGFLFQPEFKYYRVNYTNGAVAQTTFQLISTLRVVAMFPSQYRVSQAITAESQAIVTKGVIYGETTGGGGGYISVKVTPSGALTTETSISSIADVDGQKTMALSFPVVIASDQSAVPASQSGTWNINNVSGTVSLPTGAATSAIQTDGTQRTKITDGTTNAAVKAASTAAVATDPALVVAISPNNNLPTTRVGSTSANAPVYNSYSSTSITTAAYTQLVASTTSTTNAIDIFDSSGQAMILATGGAGSETIVAYVPPGGASYQVRIPAGTRVAYKALTANATSGYLLIDFWS